MSARAIGPGDLPPDHPGRRLLVGRTLLIASRRDQRFSFCAYVPDAGDLPGLNRPVLLAVHDTFRDIGALREAFVGLADECRCVVLLPLFPAAIGDPNDVDNYKQVAYRDIRFDLIVLDMLDEMAERWGVLADRCFLFGFSGGAQFAHRFAYLHPDRLTAASVAAPGRTTRLCHSASWPDGIDDIRTRFGVAFDHANLAAVPLHLVVGEGDNSVEELSPSATEKLGRRAQAERMSDDWRESGLDVTFDVVPAAGHSMTALLPSARSFLTQHIQRHEPGVR